MTREIYDGYRREVLSASLWLSEHGYFGSQRGTGGNVSVRVDGEQAMAITPSSARYQDLSAGDICIVGFDLALIEAGGALKPSMESGMHSAIYRSRPDVNAVVHTHQTYASVLAVLAEPIPALFDEVSFALGQAVEVIPYALSGSHELAANVEGKVGSNANAYLIQNHGALALGRTLEKALYHAELLEKLSHVYCLALSTGRAVHTLPEPTVEMARALRDNEVGEAARKKG
ncbi:MAG TPA: class II aldolase/adducin family protein [Deltaproteobacteria bacterium]|nr:class II aldolase/adducin family protein [Deltaproteobacteria bacterium]HOI08516.1 class II aldolase/adducin family protein [Deltaproteobacteria bacterium]